METRGTCVTGDERAEEGVGEVLVDRMFVSVDVDLIMGINKDERRNREIKAHLRSECDRDGLKDVFVSPCPCVDEKECGGWEQCHEFNQT